MTNNDLHKTIKQQVDLLRNTEKRRVRRAITNTLSTMGVESLEHLIPYLSDSDWKVKEGIIIALHNYSGHLSNYLSELLVLLKNDHVYVRQAASWLLGEIGSQEAIPHLRKICNETSDRHEYFYYVLGLALIEGKESFGDQELKKMFETQELDEWQTVVYNKYLMDLQSKDKEKSIDYSISSEALESINRILQNNTDVSKTEIKDFNDLISNHETNKIELKAVLRYDYKTLKAKSEIENGVLKTIISFMNTEGGVLLIGVNNDGIVIGLQNDYNLLGKNKRNRDGLQLKLNDLYESKGIKVKSIKLTETFFEIIEGKEICIIVVKKSLSPVFPNDGRLFVRMGNSSRQLTAKEAIEYYITHFQI